MVWNGRKDGEREAFIQTHNTMYKNTNNTKTTIESMSGTTQKRGGATGTTSWLPEDSNGGEGPPEDSNGGGGPDGGLEPEVRKRGPRIPPRALTGATWWPRDTF